MNDLENIISVIANFDNYNEGIVEVLPGKHSADGDGVIFFKPELTSIPYEKLRFILAHFELLTKKYNIKIQRTFIISGIFIIENNIYAENYKHIRQHALYDLSLNEISHLKLTEVMNDLKECQAILGGITLVEKGYSPDFILDLWSNSGKVFKIDDAFYGVPCVLEGKHILLTNGFYPAQMNQYSIPNSKIILFTFSTKESFDVLKKYFQGSAELDDRYPQSMRQHLYDHRNEYQLDSFSASRNGIHMSSNPVEGKREAKLFLDVIENYFEQRCAGKCRHSL